MGILPIDINELWTHSGWILRIVLATLCGCLIGYERSSRSKEAGIRTHAIVCLGSALMLIVSKYGFADASNADTSRVAAQIVSGVGFLGAGVIFVKHGTVSGLTTAAGMWATSGVGMCIGTGLYDVGILTTILIIGLQTLLHKSIFLKISQNVQSIQLEMNYQDNALKDIQDVFHKNGITIHEMKIEKLNNWTMYLEIEIAVSKNFDKEKLLYELVNKSYVQKFCYV